MKVLYSRVNFSVLLRKLFHFFQKKCEKKVEQGFNHFQDQIPDPFLYLSFSSVICLHETNSLKQSTKKLTNRHFFLLCLSWIKHMLILGQKMIWQHCKNIHTNGSLSILCHTHTHTHTNGFPHLYISLKKAIYEPKSSLKNSRK